MLFSIPFDCSYYDTIILMYSGFTDAEFFGGIAYGGTVFHDINGQITGTFFHIPFNDSPLPRVIFRTYGMSAAGKKVRKIDSEGPER